MKRALMIGMFVMSSLLVHANASAMTEFCPARIADDGLVRAGPEGSTLYRYAVAASSPRIVSGSIIAHAQGGWFVFPFSAPITQHVERFDTGQVKFIRTTYRSARLFVTFPASVQPTDAFVSNATATDEASFGWGGKGSVNCAAPAGLAMQLRKRSPIEPPRRIDPPPDADATPGPSSIEAKAIVTSAPGSLDCPNPFSNAKAVEVQSPEFPAMASGQFAGTTMTLVRVTVGEDGQLLGAPVVWVPSASAILDAAALSAARRSKYVGGTAFCRPAVGDYIFAAGFTQP